MMFGVPIHHPLGFQQRPLEDAGINVPMKSKSTKRCPLIARNPLHESSQDHSLFGSFVCFYGK